MSETSENEFFCFYDFACMLIDLKYEKLQNSLFERLKWQWCRDDEDDDFDETSAITVIMISMKSYKKRLAIYEVFFLAVFHKI